MKHAICIVESIESPGDAFNAQVDSEHLSRSGRFPGGVVVATWRPAGAAVTADLTSDTVHVAPIAPNPLRFVRRRLGADIFERVPLIRAVDRCREAAVRNFAL